MPKLSAGVLLFRRAKTVEVFLVHPGGPFWSKKDAGAWSVPKGEYAEGEVPLDAAKREFKEETSFVAPQGEYVELGEVKYGNKKVMVWAVEGQADAAAVRSNYIELEWPPKSGKTQQFPEVDRAGWFTLGQARKKLISGQVPLIDALQEKLGLTVNDIGPDAADSPQLTLF